MRWSAWWWGGFGFGLWRSVYPQGPIWSVAVGPVTILFRLKDKQ
jgi:hypothetical protein